MKCAEGESPTYIDRAERTRISACLHTQQRSSYNMATDHMSFLHRHHRDHEPLSPCNPPGKREKNYIPTNMKHPKSTTQLLQSSTVSSIMTSPSSVPLSPCTLPIPASEHRSSSSCPDRSYNVYTCCSVPNGFFTDMVREIFDLVEVYRSRGIGLGMGLMSLMLEVVLVGGWKRVVIGKERRKAGRKSGGRD